jgi:hypothetical protein
VPQIIKLRTLRMPFFLASFFFWLMPTSSSSHFFFSSCAKASIPGSARRNPVTRATRGRAVQWHSKRPETWHHLPFRAFPLVSFEVIIRNDTIHLFVTFDSFYLFVRLVHFICSFHSIPPKWLPNIACAHCKQDDGTQTNRFRLIVKTPPPTNDLFSTPSPAFASDN